MSLIFPRRVGKQEAQNQTVLTALHKDEKVLVLCPNEASVQRWIKQWNMWVGNKDYVSAWPNLKVETP